MPDPIKLPDAFPVPDGGQFNPGFLSDPIEATARTATGALEGGLKLAYDTYAFGYDIGNSIGKHTAPTVMDWFGAKVDPAVYDEYTSDKALGENFWQAYNSLSGEIEYGDPQRFSGIQQGVANVTPFILSTRAAATKFASWGKAANLLKNTESFKATLALNSVAGVYADIVHTRKEDASLFSLIPEENRPEFAAWFIDREDDSEFEGRFKNVIEGLFLGAVVDSGFRLAGNTITKMKGAFHQVDAPVDQMLKAVDQILGNGNGEVVDAIMEKGSLKGALRNADNILDDLANPSHRTGVLSEDAALARARLERRANILKNGSKKKRQLKKALKLETELHELDDVSFKPTETHSTAAEVRQEAQAYTPRQEVENIPAQDTLRLNINEKSIAELRKRSAILLRAKQEADDIAIAVVSDVTHSDLDRSIARDFLRRNVDSLKNIDPNLSDREAAEGIARLIGITQPAVKVASEKRPIGKLSFEAYKKLKEGSLAQNITIEAKKLQEFAKDMGYNEDGVMRSVAQINALGGSMEELFVLAKTSRGDAAVDVKKLASKILKSNTVSKEDMNAFIKALDPIDQLDSSIQGVASTSGRILRLQQESGSDLVKAAYDWASLNAEQKVKAAASGVDVIDDAQVTFFKNMSEKFSSADINTLKRTVKKVADNVDNPKSLYDSLNAPKFMDLISDYRYSSLLSGVKTLTSSVIVGNAIQTTLKSNIVPHFEAILGALFRSFNRESGSSITRGFKANYITFKTLSKIVRNYLAGDNRVPIDRLLHLSSSSAREGAENSIKGVSDYMRDYSELAEHYAKTNAYIKYPLITIAKPLLATATGVGNYMVRGIAHADEVFRGINNEVQLALEAESAYLREGGQKVFGSFKSKESFIKEFTDFQRAYSAINRDPLIKPTVKRKRLDKIFQGNKELFRMVKESVARAEKIGKEATFQQDPAGLLASAMKSLGEGLDKSVPGKIFRLSVFPFTKTPMNALDEVILHSPMAIFATRAQRAMLHGSPREKVEAYAKVLAGSSLMATAAGIWATGRMQGSIEPNDRKAYEAAGIQEHSIKIGDTWYSYAKLGPAAVYFSTMADFMSYTQHDPDASATLLFSQSLALAADESMYKTVRELLDAMELKGISGEDKATKFTLSRATRFIQPLEGMTTTAEDMFVLLTNGKKYKYRSDLEEDVGSSYNRFKRLLAESIKGNTAWRLGTENAGVMSFDRDLDVLGGDIVKTGEGPINKFTNLLGFETKDHTQSRGKAELFRLGLIPQSATGHTVQGIFGPTKITANQELDLQRELFRGSINLEGYLDNLVKTDLYTGLPLTQKKQMLKQVIEYNKNFLKQRLFNREYKLQKTDYENGLIKLMKDTTVVPEVESDDEAFDNMIFERKLYKDDSQLLKETLDTLIRPKLDDYDKRRIERNRKAALSFTGE